MNPIVTDTDKIIRVPAFSVHNMLEMVNRVNFLGHLRFEPDDVPRRDISPTRCRLRSHLGAYRYEIK